MALSRSSLAIKRTIDLVVAAIGLVLLAPIGMVIAFAIRIGSPGPVIYRQTRVGRHGVSFDMFKFRTMIDGAHERRAALRLMNETSGIFKLKDDPRLTRTGRLLRRTSLDELPQLVNVLRGEMSLVGPRPLVPEEDQLVQGPHRDRLQMTPGMTGPWQALGPVRPSLRRCFGRQGWSVLCRIVGCVGQAALSLGFDRSAVGADRSVAARAGRGGPPAEASQARGRQRDPLLRARGRVWRMLPKDFPPWETVYGYQRDWRKDGTLDRLHSALRERVRVKEEGRKAEPSAGIVDSQSVKGADTVSTDTRGYDAGKKINGPKRHIVVDTIGLLLVVMVGAASVQDRDGARGSSSACIRRSTRSVTSSPTAATKDSSSRSRKAPGTS